MIIVVFIHTFPLLNSDKNLDWPPEIGWPKNLFKTIKKKLYLIKTFDSLLVLYMLRCQRTSNTKYTHTIPCILTSLTTGTRWLTPTGTGLGFRSPSLSRK